jgi:hypothetical protein
MRTINQRAGRVLAAAALGVAGAWFNVPAYAGAGTLQVSVAAITDSVTYSQGSQQPIIGYVVNISNTGGNTINNIHFTGAAVVPTNASEAVTFSFSDNNNCQTNTALAPLDCTIGQLKAGKSAPTFLVWFTSPVQVGSSSSEAINFSGKVYYAETTGGPTSPPQNSILAWNTSTMDVTLGIPSDLHIKSGVSSKGGTFGTTPGNDPLTTTVTIPNGFTPPAGQTYTTADITNAPTTLTDNPNCNNFLVCWQTTLTIPGTFAPLTIVLHVPLSNAKPGTKINSVVLLYEDPTNSVVDYVIQGCPTPHQPRGDGLPCIDNAVTVKKQYFEWTLLNTKNGGYKIN